MSWGQAATTGAVTNPNGDFLVANPPNDGDKLVEVVADGELFGGDGVGRRRAFRARGERERERERANERTGERRD